MNVFNKKFIGALLCSFTLTGTAEAQQGIPARLHITIELDAALAMGPRVETSIPVRIPGAPGATVHSSANFDRAIGATLWSRPYVYWSDGSYSGPTLLGRAEKITDAPRLNAVTPRAKTPLELIVEALRDGRYEEAAELERAASGPEVITDRRLVALEGAGRTGEAARLLVERIVVSGDGGSIAVDRIGLTERPGEVRRMQRLAAGYLVASEDPNGFVLLASYLYGLGRSAEAEHAVQDAIEAGVSPAAADALRELVPRTP